MAANHQHCRGPWGAQQGALKMVLFVEAGDVAVHAGEHG